MSNQHPAPVTFTVDVVISRLVGNDTDGYTREVLLLQRKHEPYAGMWAFPGGKLNESDATLEHIAYRVLHEKTGIATVFLYQMGTYGDIGRDPRGRSISVVYASTIVSGEEEETVQAGSDALQVQWFPVENLPLLAFDHARILAEVYSYLHS